MQLATNTVVDGKVIVEATFEVPQELEAELFESIAEADCGETISADELIEHLQQLWIEEARSRAEEIDRGKVQTVSGEELERQVQELFK